MREGEREGQGPGSTGPLRGRRSGRVVTPGRVRLCGAERQERLRPAPGMSAEGIVAIPERRLVAAANAVDLELPDVGARGGADGIAMFGNTRWLAIRRPWADDPGDTVRPRA